MIFEGVRKKVGTYFLSNEIKAIQRKPELFSLSSANSMLVVFDCKDETTMTVVNKFLKRLREEEGVFKIDAVAYFNDKELPEYLEKSKLIRSFCQKDLNWYMFPNQEILDGLQKDPYDVLIDLTIEDSIQLKTLVTKAKAKMKIGKRMEGKLMIHDMFVDIKESESLPFLIEQVIHFLKMFNKSKLKHG